MTSDPTTQSNYLEVVTEHVSFNWNVDFDTQTIKGSAVHTLKVKKGSVREVIFDTADLNINDAEVDGKVAAFDIKPKHKVMGSALHVTLPDDVKIGQHINLKISYATTSKCTALQWLDKDQTQGKKFPYLFSQCQAIYARSLAPLQDTPSVKVTYTASVSSVLPVLLSAIRISPPSEGPSHGGKVVGKDFVSYEYNQPVPIPTYLIAIAAGNVCYRPFPRLSDKQWTTGVWAEPELIDQAYWEFSEDTARFLAAEEKIVGQYRFGVYDLLVLPPSFPYGGMENACLTFLTPTLLTGDRTLVDVVVHELTHSFFGNGVTHANASHFWLNEGWTTYMERVLQQVLHSPAHRGFSFVIGSKDLKEALTLYQDQPKYQRLVISFEKGEDPDDAYSSIPYEKGANLILHLERKLGGLDEFLPYVKDYVNTFMGKSITTEQWKDHLYGYYKKHGEAVQVKALDSVDWNAWLYGEGLELPVDMDYDLTLALDAYDLAKRWDAARSTEDTSHLDFKGGDLDKFDSNQKVVFLDRFQIYPPLPSFLIFHLGSLYHVSSTQNAEIRLRFYEVALREKSSSAAKTFAEDALKWIVGTDGSGVVKGRMKFCRPIFRLVYKVDKELAVKYFKEAKTFFHPIARKLIEKDIGLV